MDNSFYFIGMQVCSLLGYRCVVHFFAYLCICCGIFRIKAFVHHYFTGIHVQVWYCTHKTSDCSIRVYSLVHTNLVTVLLEYIHLYTQN